MNTRQIVIFAVGVAVGVYVVPRILAASSRVKVSA